MSCLIRIAMESVDLSANIVVDEAQKIPASTRYYRLHRDERLAVLKEKYNSRPDVIEKREERERKKAEKEAEKEAEKQRKKEEREANRIKKLSVAIKTSRFKEKVQGNLGQFLEESSPGM